MTQQALSQPSSDEPTSARGWTDRYRRLLEGGLRRFAARGIDLILPDGQRLGTSERPVASVRLKDFRAAQAYLLRDQLELFDCYLEQRLDFLSEREDEAESLLLFWRRSTKPPRINAGSAPRSRPRDISGSRTPKPAARTWACTTRSSRIFGCRS